jgi:two-component system response regulator (stage 0 sporulation protein F)
LNGPLILVVDDQAGVRLLLREVFREVGYRVALAAHGQEAVAMASVELPALALVDLKMPVMDGLETLRALKELDPTLPVLIMTAVGEGRISELLQNGARDCIMKPFDVFQLRDRVQQVLQEEGRA